MITPYYAVTGFMSEDQVSRANGHAWDAPAGRRVMVAILVSDKSLRGEPMAQPWVNRYPNVDTVEAMWRHYDQAHLLRAVHFNSRLPALAAQLGEVVRRIPSVEAIQLNIYRPNVEEIRAFRRCYPGIGIVLQVGPRVLADFSQPKDLSTYLELYCGLVDWVLLDASGGTGKPFDTGLRALLEQTPWSALGILPGVAGGLSAETVDRLKPFLEQWPDLCWDAEGRLMAEGQGLVMERVSDYLAASRNLLLGR